MKNNILVALTAGALLLTGCSLAPEYQRPEVETLQDWNARAQGTGTEIVRNWWSSFGSDELDDLMAQALARNTDLRAGLQRIEQARASLKIAGASLTPSIDGSAGVSRRKTNPASGRTSYATSLTAGLDVSYELDLFGANRAVVDKAQADFVGSLYDQDALALVMMGDVAGGYFSLLSLRERLDIADYNLKNAREVLRIIEVRVREGAESDLELARQKSAVASREAGRAALREQISNAENALAVLTGKPPGSVAVEKNNLNDLMIPSVNPGQPSDLLTRRPDLRSAEADLIAANADIGAARAAFFPSISLGLGETISTAGFGDPTATVLSAASSLAAPVFRGGQLAGGVERATARQLELAEIYRGSVLNAFREVEDALAAVEAAKTQEVALKTAMEQAERAYTLSKKLYDAGAIDFQTLLDTQDTQLSAEDSYAQIRLARLSAAIDLYKALGGSWASVR